MFRSGDEGTTVERAVFGYDEFELGHSLNYEPRPSCIKIYHLGIERRQNTIDVDIDGSVHQLWQGVEMTYDVVDVSVHFSRKGGAATYMDAYGSVHTHKNIYYSVWNCYDTTTTTTAPTTMLCSVINS